MTLAVSVRLQYLHYTIYRIYGIYSIYSIYTAHIYSISARARMPSCRQYADCAAAWSLGLSRVVQPSFCTDPFPIGTKEWKYPVDRYISLTTAGVMTPRQTPIIYWAPIPEHIHIQHLQGEISTYIYFSSFTAHDWTDILFQESVFDLDW